MITDAVEPSATSISPVTEAVEPSATLLNPLMASATPHTEVDLWSAPTQATIELDNSTLVPLSDLDCYTEEVVKHTLANTFIDPAQPKVSALTLLTKAKGVAGKRKVAEDLLAQLRQQSETGGVALAAVFRFVEINQLWKDPNNATVTSAADFLRTLEGNDTIQANLIAASKLMHNRRLFIKEIEQSWGQTWFTTVSKAIPDRSWKVAECTSRDKLLAIKNNVKDGLSLETALSGWKEAIKRRTDPDLRRTHRIKGSYDAVLTIADIKSVRPGVRSITTAMSNTTRASSTTSQVSTADANAAAASLTTSATGRQKRTQQNQQTGTSKRQATTTNTTPKGCHGQVLAKFYKELVEISKDPTKIKPGLAQRAGQCCDTCKVLAQAANKLLLDSLLAYADKLESTTVHCKGGQAYPALPANSPTVPVADDESSEDES